MRRLYIAPGSFKNTSGVSTVKCQWSLIFATRQNLPLTYHPVESHLTIQSFARISLCCITRHRSTYICSHGGLDDQVHLPEGVLRRLSLAVHCNMNTCSGVSYPGLTFRQKRLPVQICYDRTFSYLQICVFQIFPIQAYT